VSRNGSWGALLSSTSCHKVSRRQRLSSQPFLIQNQAVVLRTQRGAVRVLNRMIVAVAILALIIGGVGVAAVMLLSVRERGREIGLRRAVGARRSDIQLQFLLEAAVLAGAGSIAGVAAGLVATTAVSVLGRWDVVFSWPAATIGVLAATILGFAVGVIPAARAVRLQPVAALRQ
jgi:putative ABC transport system permease protein